MKDEWLTFSPLIWAFGRQPHFTSPINPSQLVFCLRSTSKWPRNWDKYSCSLYCPPLIPLSHTFIRLTGQFDQMCFSPLPEAGAKLWGLMRFPSLSLILSVMPWLNQYWDSYSTSEFISFLGCCICKHSLCQVCFNNRVPEKMPTEFTTKINWNYMSRLEGKRYPRNFIFSNSGAGHKLTIRKTHTTSPWEIIYLSRHPQTRTWLCESKLPSPVTKQRGPCCPEIFFFLLFNNSPLSIKII